MNIEDITISREKDIQEFLRNASHAELWAVDEFIGVLEKTGDSGSVCEVLQACIRMTSIEYVREIIDLMEKGFISPTGDSSDQKDELRQAAVVEEHLTGNTK